MMMMVLVMVMVRGTPQLSALLVWVEVLQCNEWRIVIVLKGVM